MKLTLLLSALLLVSSAQAQTTRFEDPVGPGSTASRELFGGRSYTCHVSDDGSYGLSRTVKDPQGRNISAIFPEAQADHLKDRLSRSHSAGDTNLSNNLISFITPTGADAFGSYTFTMASASEDARSTYIYCEETSLLCSFNTFVNDFNFLEVTNTGHSPAVVHYLATDFEGNTFSSVGTVAAGARADFDIHSQVGSQKFGKIVVQPLIASDFKESVRARLSQYKGTELSFTEACQPLPFIAEDGQLDGKDVAD